jgi:polysaccharide export outer membrane protein
MKNIESCMRFLAVLAVAFVLAIVPASAQDRAAVANTVVTGSTGFGSGAAGPIGAGDLLEVSVFDTPELSGKLRVSNLGDVSFPLIGVLHMQGMTVEQAQSLIRQKLMEGGFVRDPQVTIFAAEYATQGVSVVGEVHKPGVYPAFGEHRLLDYLSLAEGFTPLAGTTIMITHAGHSEEPQKVRVTGGASPGPENNPQILPGDTIFVEHTGLVYVVGDVARPGGFPMDHDEHLTILQALALAQGTNYTAAKGSSKLIRTTAQGRLEIPVDLKKIMASKATDLAMQDDDILFIPSSTTKSALKGVGAALPAVAGATIYRVP